MAAGRPKHQKPEQYQEQPVDISLLRALLEDAGDPDYEILDSYPVGVRIGVGVVLPRTPAVYEERVKWRLPEQGALSDKYAEAEVEGAWRANYTSAKLLRPQVVKEWEDSHRRGLALKLEEAEAHVAGHVATGSACLPHRGY